MSQDVSPPGKASDSHSKRARLEEAVAAGREKRRRNRELLQQREHAHDPPPNATLAVVKLLLCAVLFLPLVGFGVALVLEVEEHYGSTASWIVALAGAGLLAAIIYNGPRLVGASANDVIGLFKYRKQNPAAFWGAIAMILGLFLWLYLALQRNSAIH